MDIKASPWLIYPADEGAIIWPLTDPVFITAITFEDYTEYNHRAVLEDGNGRRIFETPGSSDFGPVHEQFTGCLQVRGLVCRELTTGHIKVHIR